MDIFEQVCEIIRTNMDFDESMTFTEEMTFDEMELDSIDVIDCIMSIEDEMGIKIEDEELETGKTLGDIVDIVRAKKGI